MRISDWSSDVCSSDLLRGIANVFAKLDRRFRSHNGFKIGARLIIDRALNEWGSWDRYERRDTLRDVERVFLELDEKPPVSEGHSIASQVADSARVRGSLPTRSEEHTSELQSLMRISYAVFCLKNKTHRLNTEAAILQHTENKATHT